MSISNTDFQAFVVYFHFFAHFNKSLYLFFVFLAISKEIGEAQDFSRVLYVIKYLNCSFRLTSNLPHLSLDLSDVYDSVMFYLVAQERDGFSQACRKDLSL